jgi:hypothetical protein
MTTDGYRPPSLKAGCFLLAIAFVAPAGTQIVTLLGIQGRVMGYTVLGMTLAGIL